MSFNFSIHKHKLKSKATSSIKIIQDLSSLSLNDVGIYLRDGPFSSDVRIVNLHQTKRTHWFVYMNENFFVSYGCGCPKKLSNCIIKRKGYR